MKKVLVSLLLLVTAAWAQARSVVTVIDSDDGAPVPGAVVVSAKGIIIGLTESDGTIATGENEFPLSIRSMGYQPVTVTSLTDTIVIHPASFNLNEVVVRPIDRPVMRVITYVREYTTGLTSKDTMLTYNEYMLEYFFVDGKVKGYKKSDATPRIRNIISYDYENVSGKIKYELSDDNDNAMPEFFMELMAATPTGTITEPESMTQGAASDTIMGKHYPKYIWRRNGNLTTVQRDAVADKKNHSWKPWFLKLMGMTTDITSADWHHAFRTTDSGRYTIYDNIYSTANVACTLKGKMFKIVGGIDEDMDVNIYIEQYPVEITHYSVEEYRQMRENRSSRIPFQIPEHVLPMLPAAEELKERVLNTGLQVPASDEFNAPEPDPTDEEIITTLKPFF